MSEQNEKKGSSPIVLVLLLVVAGVFGFMWFSANSEKAAKEAELVQVTKEKKSLDEELMAKIDALKALQTEKDSADSEIAALIADLEKTRADLKKANNSAWNYKNQVKKLNKKLARYDVLIDSLNTANLALANANDSLSLNLTSTKGQLNNLQGEFDKNMSIAKLLVASNIKGEGRRMKPNGKVQITDKAKKVNNLNVCFNVNENKLTKAGMKTVYLSITGPDQKVLTIENKGSGKLRLVDIPEEVMYSTSKKINYTNNNMNVCIDWEQNTPFAAGNYKANLYGDGYKMGMTQFSLR